MMHTDKRDYELLEDIASYFDILAADCRAWANRGISKRTNTARAQVWEQAAADVRSIEIVGVERPAPAERMEKADG